MAKTEQQLLPDRYQDVERIAAGGMGEIYRARDSVLDRTVAVKLLSSHYSVDSDLRERFLREGLSAARLSSDRDTVTIYDVGECHGRPYIVMEYMGGGTLADRLAGERPQPPGEALAWLEQAARALDNAHREGVVHRDIKPGNLLLDDAENVHVADFGIASATGMDSMTMTGTVLGTVGYLAPEQAQGLPVTSATDRYALAVVAFELLTGTRPFANESPTAEATAHVNAPVPDASARADLPPEVDAVFERALAKDPGVRYPSALEFVASLREAFDNAAGRTRTLAPVAPAPRPPRRTAMWVAALVALAASGVIVAALLAANGPETTASPPATTKKEQTRKQPTTTAPTTTAPTTTAAPPPTTTAAPATTAAPPPTTTAPAPTTGGHGLNGRGYELLLAGDPAGALPLLQQAVVALRGVGPADPTEAYANYNLGVALMQLGRCTEAVPYLEHSVELQPDRETARKGLKEGQKCARREGR
jgi:serine/threonine-protein kinase